MGTRTVYVNPYRDPVRLAEPVEARIYARNDKGEWVKGTQKAKIPEGLWILGDPGTK